MRLAVAVLLLLGISLAGCGARHNLLRNGGFEEGGGEPWHKHPTSTDWLPFELTSEHALAGNRSLRTHVTSHPGAGASVIAGGLQEVALTPGHNLPRTLSGSFYVSNWSSDAPRTYVQAVVMLEAAPGADKPQCQDLPNDYPCQVAFVLGGVEEPPLDIGNRRFVFVRSEVPPLGRWVPFSLPVARTFAEQWGTVEPPTERLSVYLEARYESRDAPANPRVDVDVAWDEVRLA